jgi:protein involved in polysaccharide export with SLBB domain
MSPRTTGVPAFPYNQPPYKQKEPPTEFQQYVAASTGQMLPIFGAVLFENVPATFAPVDRVPVGADYLIAPGDGLQIAVWGQFNLTRRLVVDRNGEITLPDAGPVSVSGMNYIQAAAVVKSALSHLYKNFDVSVTLARLHTIQIFVVGEARRPGSYSVSSLSTLVNAIFASGGPSSRGSMRRILLKRGGQTIREFDLYQLLIDGDKSKDAQLASGDVILIPPAGPRVAITGSVGHPAIYELNAETSLEEALQCADGLSPLASRSKILVERVANGTGLKVLHLGMTPSELDTPLTNGDIVRLLPLVQRFENAVTLRGNVANPGRFPWKDGMRISDLIPNREFLLTRDYWKERNALGSVEETAPVDDNEPAPQSPPGPSPGNDGVVMQQIGMSSTAKNHTAPAPAFREEARNTQGDSSLGASMGLDNLLPVRKFNPRYTVEPAVPEINWAYAVIERTDPDSLETHNIPFHLGKVIMSHENAEDLRLRPGDVVTIFSKADFSVPRNQQATQVRIEGEVTMAGIYTVNPGETLRQVVARAGGLTPNAYLYGAQFTRESTRREQQKRFEDFLNQLERDANEVGSNLSARVTSPQQAATAQTSLTSQHDLIEKLRKTSMDGRIVLDIQPNQRGVASLPDLSLENGDRLYIPSRPSTVNVVGNVFEQASFLYQDDYRVSDYLKKAGGPARSADRSHMFVIRADGSVVSNKSTPNLFAKGFDTLPMFPGDTLIVPTYLNKTTLVRGLIDWSTIFTNFALGAAAINVLH